MMGKLDVTSLNVAVEEILARILKGLECSVTSASTYDSESLHQSPKAKNGFSLDVLMTAKSSLKKYPLVISNLSEELRDIDGFSESLIHHILQTIDDSFLRSLVNNTRATEKTQSLAAHSSISVGLSSSRHAWKVLKILEMQKYTSMHPTTLAMVVDSRERSGNKRLIEHIGKVKKDLSENHHPHITHENLGHSDHDLDHFLQGTSKIHQMHTKKKAKRPRKSTGTHGFSIRENMLPLGDIIWVADNGSDDFILPLIIERKTVVDLASSIVDGRLYSQLDRLKLSGSPWIVFLVEGSMSDSEQCSVPEQSLRSALNTIALENKFLVFSVNNMRESILLLKYMSRNLISMFSTYPQNALCGEFTRRSYSEWTKYIKESDVNRRKSMCFYNMLSAIDGVGHESAEKVALTFRTALDLYRHFHRIVKIYDEIHAEFSLTTYKENTSNNAIKLCPGSASSAIFKAFYGSTNDQD